MISVKTTLSNFLTFGIVIGLFSTNANAQTVLYKIPKIFATGGKTFTNVEGFIVDISSYQQITKTVPDLYNTEVRCNAIGSSFGTARSKCDSGTTYTCKTLYQNSPYKPTARSSQLVPLRSVQTHLLKYHNANPGKKVIAINLGFFDTRPFPNRSTDDNVWKPLFQEPCMVNLGTYRSPSDTNGFYGTFNDTETKADGSADRNFGTLIFRSDGSTGRAKFSNIDDRALQGDLAMNGAYLRYDGFDQNGNGFPQFVKDKAASIVGRTAIGINTTSKQMRIVVVQPGRDPARTGLAIDDVRKFFDINTYPNVLLLDGSGSSQLAANFGWQTIGGQTTTPGRQGCLNSATMTCTFRGDSVAKAFVENWGPDVTYQDPRNAANYLVDRRVANVLVLISD